MATLLLSTSNSQKTKESDHSRQSGGPPPFCFKGRLWPALIPVALAAVCNVGLIFRIPCLIPQAQFIVDYLLEVKVDNISHEMLVGLATLFVVMFTVLAFVYQDRRVPPFYVGKYIMRRPETHGVRNFLFASLLVTTALAGQEKIPRIDSFLLYLLVSLSVWSIWAYFRWTVWSADPENIVATIIQSHLSIPQRTRKTLVRAEEEFNRELSECRDPKLGRPKITTVESRDLMVLSSDIENPFVLCTRDRSVITRIRIEKLLALLTKEELPVEEVFIAVRVGEALPLFSEYRTNTTDYPLAAVVLKDSGEPDLVGHVLHLQLLEEKLLSCFELDKGLYARFAGRIEDLSEVFRGRLAELGASSDAVLLATRDYLEREFGNTREKGGLKTLEDSLLWYFLSGFIQLFADGLSERQFQALLSLLNILAKIAARRADERLASDLFKILKQNFIAALGKGDTFDQQIFRHTINLQALLFRLSLSDGGTKVSKGKGYHQDILQQSIAVAVISINAMIIHHYQFKPGLLKMYLRKNVQDYLNLFLFVSGSSLAAVRAASRDEAINLVRGAVYISAHMFLGVRKYGLPIEIVRNIGFPLASVAQTAIRGESAGNDLLDALFWDEQFHNPYDVSFDNIFDLDDIFDLDEVNPSGLATTHRLFDFNQFWVALSLYRKASGLGYLPCRLPDESQDAAKKRVAELKTEAEFCSYRDVGSLVTPLELEFERLRSGYLNYLDSL